MKEQVPIPQNRILELFFCRNFGRFDVFPKFHGAFGIITLPLKNHLLCTKNLAKNEEKPCSTFVPKPELLSLTKVLAPSLMCSITFSSAAYTLL